MAWTRKILRVNLTKGTCTSEALNMEWAMDYLGSRGLASKYLVEEIEPFQLHQEAQCFQLRQLYARRTVDGSCYGMVCDDHLLLS